MKKTYTLPDGSVEVVEGTPEEIADYEAHLGKNPRPQNEGTKKRLLLENIDGTLLELKRIREELEKLTRFVPPFPPQPVLPIFPPYDPSIRPWDPTGPMWPTYTTKTTTLTGRSHSSNPCGIEGCDVCGGRPDPAAPFFGDRTFKVDLTGATDIFERISAFWPAKSVEVAG